MSTPIQAGQTPAPDNLYVSSENSAPCFSDWLRLHSVSSHSEPILVVKPDGLIQHHFESDSEALIALVASMIRDKGFFKEGTVLRLS